MAASEVECEPAGIENDPNLVADDIALVDEWILWQRGRNLSDKTITERSWVIRRLPHAVDITAHDIDAFLTSRAWSRSTRATYHGAIRSWCQWLVLTGHRQDDPTLIATPPKVPKGRPRPLADEHLTVLLGVRTHSRTKAMILLGAYAGVRVGEIARVRGEDVDALTKTITVIGKGGKRRDVPLHPLLERLARQMPARSWWFPTWVGNCRHPAGGPMLANSVSAVVSKAMHRAGIPGTPHALRHWFGSTLRAHGVDSLVIKELMGHESLGTTAIYVDVPLRQRADAVIVLPDISLPRRPVSSARSPIPRQQIREFRIVGDDGPQRPQSG